MLLIKRTSAWDELVELEENELLEKDAIDLITVLFEEGMQDSLDNVVAHEFPEGVEIDELTEFFNGEAKFICDEIGILEKFEKYQSGEETYLP